MARYELNEAAVRRCRELIDAKQYVLDSEWGETQPNAAAQNSYLENHSWEEYAGWHLGLTEGADRHQGEVRVRLRRLPAGAPQWADRLRLPGVGVAAQAGRARGSRPAAEARRSRRDQLAGP